VVLDSFRALRLNLDVDRDCLANAGNGLGAGSEEQIEVAPVDWVSRHSPACAACFIYRCQQFHMKGGRSGHAVHREVADDVAALRPGALHTSALKSHVGKFFHVKEFRAAQMIVPFLDARVDAAHVDLCCNGGILRMLAVHIDLTAKSCEFSLRGAEELMHRETDCRAGRIELVGLIRRRGGTQCGDCERSEKMA